MRITSTLALAAAAFSGVMFSGSALASTVITFDASNNGQTALPSSYQPLLNGYAGDGGPLGITINWGGTWSSTHALNSGVTDHTTGPGGSGAVGYDGGALSNTITFDHAVTLPSFYFANYSAGTFTIEFDGYTNIGDAAPVIQIFRTYNQPAGYTWIEETGFAGVPITAFTFTGATYKQLDDITVAAVPEASTWAMMIAGFGMVGFGLRSRRKQATRVTYA